MSVLDTIKEAEAVAQQKKTGAAQQARETVAKAQEDAREKARDIRDNARKEADALLDKGAVTGYFGGIVDDVLMRLGDVLTAFPSILLALVVISLLGPGKTRNVILALGLVFIPSFARMARGTYAGLREVNYVKSARLMGASSSRILWRHILPNTWSVLLPALTIGFNNAVLAEASMSYLCIGVTPPDASLGYMLSESQGMFMSVPWYALGTGLTLVWMVFGVGLIGEGLQRRGGGEV